jgi:hypothetical protein
MILRILRGFKLETPAPAGVFSLQTAACPFPSDSVFAGFHRLHMRNDSPNPALSGSKRDKNRNKPLKTAGFGLRAIETNRSSVNHPRPLVRGVALDQGRNTQ